MRAWYLLKVADRWLGVRLESCGAVLVLFASIFAVVAVAYPAESGVTISGGIAGVRNGAVKRMLAWLSAERSGLPPFCPPALQYSLPCNQV